MAGRASAPKLPTRRSGCASRSIRSSMFRRKGRCERSASISEPCRNSAPKFCACFFMFSTSSGPLIPSGKPGKFSTRVVSDNWPPASFPSDHQRFQIRPGRIDGRRVSGATRANDHDVMHLEFRFYNVARGCAGSCNRMVLPVRADSRAASRISVTTRLFSSEDRPEGGICPRTMLVR